MCSLASMHAVYHTVKDVLRCSPQHIPGSNRGSAERGHRPASLRAGSLTSCDGKESEPASEAACNRGSESEVSVVVDTQVLEGQVIINDHPVFDIYQSYDWGRFDGYDDGYKKGYAEGVRAAFWEFSRKRERK